MADRLPKLLYYIQRGWPVFPCHWIGEDGRCSCGKGDCKSPGKHPLTANGFLDASLELDQVSAWHQRYPSANWGLATGSLSKIFVIDIDPRNGGFDTWDILRAEHPEPFETVTVKTGGGGLHYWCALPEGMNFVSRSGIWPGIDIKCDRGYILAPPSKTVEMYRFQLAPTDTVIEPPPDWVLEQLSRQKISVKALNTSGGTQQGERHHTLISSAGSMRRVGMDGVEIRQALMAIRDNRLEPGDHPVTDAEVDDIAKWIVTKPDDLAFTDLGNAERFVRQHGANLLYSHKWDKWLFWDGRRWAIDESGEVYRRAHLTVRSIYLEASSTEEEQRRQDIARHALRSENKFRVESMLETAKHYLPVAPDELDQDPMLLNCKNGVLDLRTAALLPHQKDFKITKIVHVDFDESAECPRWETFLKMICGGNRDLEFFLQMATGYTLTGLTDEHSLLFLYGAGKNGKSTFLETLRRLFGDYGGKIDVDSLMLSVNRGQAASPYVAGLKGTRFVFGTEIPESRRLDEALIKDITGGDAITARYLFGNPFTFQPTHKLWLFGNHKPKITGTDLGIWRRIRVIPFLVTIPDELQKPMSEVLAEFDEEMSGILTWAVTGCLLWQSNKMDTVAAVEEATREYKSEQDLILQFIDECCQRHPDYSEGKDMLYTAWRAWCERSGEESAKNRSRKWFTQQMTAHECTSGGHGRSDIVGIKLK